MPANQAASGGSAGDGIALTAGALSALRKTRPWVFFLGIMCTIGAVLIALDALANLVMLFAASNLTASGRNTAGPVFTTSMLGIMLVYVLVVCGVLVLAAVWLFQYAGAIRGATDGSQGAQGSLDRALGAQRKLWALMGIYACALLLISIVAGVVFAVVGFQLPHFPQLPR